MSQLKIKDNGNWIPIPAGGIGVPSGGTAGQVLTKSSSTDYATEWATPYNSAVTLLATATTANTEYTFSEPLTNFRNIRFVIDYSGIVLNSIELDVTTVLNSGNVIVCFNDGNGVRKGDVGSITATSMKTAGATNFKDISHLYVYGLK